MRHFGPSIEGNFDKASRFENSLWDLLRGYMLVCVHDELAPWCKINDTKAVSRLLSFHGKSKALPLLLISGLKLCFNTSGKMLLPELLFKVERF